MLNIVRKLLDRLKMLNTVFVEQIIRTGKNFQLLYLLTMSIAVYYAYSQAKTGKTHTIRPIEALQAISDSIGRCAEMGRPILVTPGIANLTGTTNAQTIAGLTVLGEVAQQAAAIGVEVTTNASSEQVVIASEAIMRNALTSVGREDLYEPGKYVRWFGADQFSYAVGCAGQILDEKPGLIIFMGYFLADTIITGETASRVGAIKIGGTLGALAFLAMMCDYLLIGEEMFAASASITKDPHVLATLAAQDWIKVAAIILMTIGVLLYAVNIDILYTIMGA